MQAVIMAGGKGTRLRSITNDEIPKPMAPIAGKPILQWQVECLRENGFTQILLVTGHLGEKIADFFGDGSAFGVQISYFQEQFPLGTAGALAYLRERLQPSFLLVFGDVIFDVDIARMEAFHQQKNAIATLFVHPNSHPHDSDLVITGDTGRVQGFHSKNSPREGWYPNCVNAGFYLLDRSICDSIPQGQKCDLERDILEPLVQKGEAVYAYRSPEYIKDVGTPERIAAAAQELCSGKVAARNLRRRQRCLFVDRDGTLNVYRGLISREEELALEPVAAQAVRLANQAGWLTIVITNQPVVARGLCSVAQVKRIHNKLETLLGQEGALLDDILFCPHHPDKGYPEENPAYKIPCRCRKPDIGLIEECIRRYHIDPAASWMIGDTTIDLQTGVNAGLHTALVLTGEAGKDQKYQTVPQLTAANLLEAVQTILAETIPQ